MSAPAGGESDPNRRATKLLAIILIVLAVLPLVVFATDLPNGLPLRQTRRASLHRAGVQAQDPATRMERQREARAKRHPTVPSVVLGMSVQLFWVVAAGVVGRRLFKLRL